MPATKSVADVVKDHLVTNWALGTVPKFEVTYETVQVHEPTKNTVRVAGAKGWRAPAGKGKENEYNRVKIYLHSPTDGLAEDFAAHVRAICTNPMPAGVDFAYFRDVEDTSERAGKVGLFGRYQYTLELLLESHSLPAGSPSPITGASVGYWATWSFVTINAEGALAGSTRLLAKMGAFDFDLKPLTDDTFDIGDATHRIKSLHVKDLTVTGSIIGLEDADIPDALTLDTISSAGAIALKPSGDVDDFLQFYTSANVPRMKAIGGNPGPILETDTAWQVWYLGNTGTYIGRHDGPYAVFVSDGNIYLMPNSDIDDYLACSTAGGIPRLASIGGGGLELYVDATSALLFNGTGDITKIGQDVPAANEILSWDGDKAVWVPQGGHDRLHALNSALDHSGDLDYTQVDAIVNTSGAGSATKLARSDHTHTAADGSSNIPIASVTNLAARILYGSAAQDEVPCIPLGGKNGSSGLQIDPYIWPQSTGTAYMYFLLPLPASPGSLKLYLNGWRIGINAAGASDYVTRTQVLGFTTSTTTLDDDTTDYTTPGDKSRTFGADIDCSGYRWIMVKLTLTIATIVNLKLAYVNLVCYYA